MTGCDNKHDTTRSCPIPRTSQGLVVNMNYACAERARALSAWLNGKDWTADSLDIRHAALGGTLYATPPTVPFLR